MNLRAFIITVDSFLGTTLMFIFLALSFFFLSQISLSSWNNVDLRNAVGDEAAILEKNLVLENAVNQSSSEAISAALNSIPGNYCFEAVVLDASDSSLVMDATKAGCIKSSSSVFALNRAFVVRNSSSVSFYLVRLEGWIK